MKTYGEGQNLASPPHLNPLTNRHQNLHRWLHWGYLPPCKIISKAGNGFRFCTCMSLRTKLFTQLFSGGS